MPEQNKTQAPTNSRQVELENDLIGNEVDQTKMLETSRTTDGTKFHRQYAGGSKQFQIQSGFRRRHPANVLHNWVGSVSSPLAEPWVKAMEYESEKFTVPKESGSRSDDDMSNQHGISYVADKNFNSRKPLLDRMHVVGV